ncbi:SURF1 family cytochrome oxidase biogenesis protein [Sinosporangium siamense]|uniref:SURF1-like protein n=1 Tax=Sinosporangium siamense TaxID=1367973 RepID=A0A919RNS3_9ACTN|nr:SURF1 family protein [Sinosporangium siamense]GII95606.1 SURF1-like protein [Sinosporangium siamense]
MYRFLLTPRWLVLHVVVLLVIPAFVLLGQWQFGRYEEQSSATDLATGNLAAAPVPIGSLLPEGGTAEPGDKFRTVTATGTYDVSNQTLVRRRPQNGQTGFYVLTPLITGQGQAVLVNRGWVKAGASADAVPDVPPPPAGQVAVTGRLRLSETEESSGIRNRAGLPPGQVLLIDVPAIGGRMPYKMPVGYVDLTEQSPAIAAAPEPVPPPDVGGGGGLNLAYGVQWWLFIGIAVGGWLILIRREAADLRQAAAKEAEDSAAGQNTTEAPANP